MTTSDIRDLVPVLETERLILRGHTSSDCIHSAAMWADPEVVRLISGQTATEAQSWGRILNYAGLWHHLGYGYWAVFERSSDAFLGEVGFADFKRALVAPVSGVPEIGWAFRTAVQGQGFAIEAVRRIVAWADQSLPHPETFCIVDPKHERSLSLATKVGYEVASTGKNAGKDVLIMSRPRRG
ncbi:GNAT family N-acetyltransferase [Alphaproteobacteria bacterium GH1-50]|uniref:GNAT family N-acetyltransferase n=1 Tax=Kangsaoukella pontilimi TaxID=2691042 RepID=A0A7C9MCZ3_9RHOB|nr:GNAT family N-acetyltransferase [Kangsaoukella pontilimi]MXQ09793.1 GNAT family N-acetyltransferase [Kangsaoukella pontilimi]